MKILGMAGLWIVALFVSLILWTYLRETVGGAIFGATVVTRLCNFGFCEKTITYAPGWWSVITGVVGFVPLMALIGHYLRRVVGCLRRPLDLR